MMAPARIPVRDEFGIWGTRAGTVSITSVMGLAREELTRAETVVGWVESDLQADAHRLKPVLRTA